MSGNYQETVQGFGSPESIAERMASATTKEWDEAVKEKTAEEVNSAPNIKAWKGRVKLKQKGARGNALIPIIILQTPADLDTEQFHMLKPSKSYFRKESGSEQDWKPLDRLQLTDAKTQTYRVR